MRHVDCPLSGLLSNWFFNQKTGVVFQGQIMELLIFRFGIIRRKKTLVELPLAPTKKREQLLKMIFIKKIKTAYCKKQIQP
jgi:hypothetical protein